MYYRVNVSFGLTNCVSVLSLPQQGDGAGVGFECSVGMAACGAIDIDTLLKRFAEGGGAVPAVAEGAGAEDALSPAGEDVETVVARQRCDKGGAESAEVGMAAIDDVGEPCRGFGGLRQEDTDGVGDNGTQAAAVGDVEAVGVGRCGAADGAVDIGEGALAGGVGRTCAGGYRLERGPVKHVGVVGRGGGGGAHQHVVGIVEVGVYLQP